MEAEEAKKEEEEEECYTCSTLFSMSIYIRSVRNSAFEEKISTAAIFN